MKFFTDFADQAVVLPLVFAIAVTLALQGWRRGALVWFVAIGATFAAMLALKVAFLACEPISHAWNLHSPSGHTAAAAVVAGGAAGLISRRVWFIAPLALLAALLFGLSRIVLGMHSGPEVLVGGAVGVAGGVALPVWAGPPPVLRLGQLAAVAFTVIVVFHGVHLPAERFIRGGAHRIGLLLPFCQADELQTGLFQAGAVQTRP
jgi:membrane-associated phospholipid phosphatase